MFHVVSHRTSVTIPYKKQFNTGFPPDPSRTYEVSLQYRLHGTIRTHTGRPPFVDDERQGLTGDGGLGRGPKGKEVPRDVGSFPNLGRGRRQDSPPTSTGQPPLIKSILGTYVCFGTDVLWSRELPFRELVRRRTRRDRTRRVGKGETRAFYGLVLESEHQSRCKDPSSNFIKYKRSLRSCLISVSGEWRSLRLSGLKLSFLFTDSTLLTL